MFLQRLNKGHRILLGIFVFLFLLLFLIPRIAKVYIIKHSNELVGRMVAIDKIRLNYFSGVLRIKEFTLFENDNKTPFLSFDRLLVNLDYWPLLKDELRLSKIELKTLYCQVEQDNDRFNFSDMIPVEDSVHMEKVPEDGSDSSSLIISLKNISISGSTLQYTDNQLEHTIKMDNINLFIPGFSFTRGATRLALDLNFTEGGGFYANIDFNQVDSTYAIDLRIDSMNLDIVEPYIKSSLAFRDLQGYYSNDIALKGNLKHILELQLKGWNKIEAMNMTDHQNREILGFDRLYINLDTCLLDRMDFNFSEIALDSLYFFIEVNDSLNNWLAMLVPSDSTVTDTLEPESKADSISYNFSVQKVSMSNGKIIFRDMALNETFEASLEDININSSDISQTSTDVKIKMAATINESAELASDLVLNLVNSDDMSIYLDIEKFAMKDLEPYFTYYFGYPVESGFMNFSTSSDLSETALTSNNRLYIRNFKLGNSDKSNAKIKLPLKLAIGILTDKNGIIELDIPVEGEGEDISVKNAGKLIAQTFGKLIVKIVTQPMEFLASMFAADAEKLKEIKFTLFESRPDEEALETMDLLVKILSERPQLKVQLENCIDKEYFRDSVALQLATREYMLSTDQQTIPPDSVIFHFVSAKLKKPEASAETLAKLCREYAGEEFLNQQLDSTRISQSDFINDYFRSYNQVSTEQYTIVYFDSVPDDPGYSHFIVNFRANEQDAE